MTIPLFPLPNQQPKQHLKGRWVYRIEWKLEHRKGEASGRYIAYYVPVWVSRP